MTTDIDELRHHINCCVAYGYLNGETSSMICVALDELEAARAEIALLRDAIVTIRDFCYADANARDIYISAIVKSWETLPDNPLK